MEQAKDYSSKSKNISQDSLQRAGSQDLLESSSASSVSILVDQSDVQSSYQNQNILCHGQTSSPESRASMDEALKSEKAFIEFVMSLPPKDPSEVHYHRSTDSVVQKSKSPTAAAGNATKVGLDHLDNLCKLMEQLSDLRETNNKLQRRVQYLEDLKTLHDMHKEISEDNAPSLDAERPTNSGAYELQKSATESCCPKKMESLALTSRSPSKYHSRRGRSQSAGGERRERSKSVGHEDGSEDTKSKRLFPKWSRVKEAFGFESERKDSVKLKGDVDTGSIRIPRRSSEDSRQSLHQHPVWCQGYESIHSSLEDVNEILDAGRWKRSSIATEKCMMRLEAPKENLRRQKSTPSPGSEKIMLYRETTDLKQKSSTIERDTYNHPDYTKFDKDESKRGKSPWGRVKTIIERRRDSLKRRSVRRDHPCTECDSSKKGTDPSDTKACPDQAESRHSLESYKHKGCTPSPVSLDQELEGCGPRTPSSSPSSHRKSRWTRVKKALKGKKDDEPSTSTPASPNSVQDGHFPFDVIEEISQDSGDEEGREMKRVGSDSHVHQMALSAPTCDLMVQLQRNLSEDFHRKIVEWERIRSSGGGSAHWDSKIPVARARKKSERDEKGAKTKIKDLTWLEKELQKIEKEKQRLSKERQKYEERALRLEKLKETVLNAKNSNKREVFVRTSAGEFRFEGISDAFTKKLYEWETKRGLGPELSTIALLDSSRLTPSGHPKAGPLQRVVSRSESSIAEIGQLSHNSSNSLPSLKLPESVDANRTDHPSRANSEPDLTTLAAMTNESNASMSNLSRRGDSVDEGATSPGVSRESEEDELDKKREDSETYYSLLEENVILLEQLKDKEEICRRLEKELQVLDKKVDVMNEHHVQETERYREKLWEMHKPGATPRDVQCCLMTMAQLRKRIETLEKCTEKLRNDRESVEDRFRYHSKEQEDMTLDLLQKMRELQAAGNSTVDSEEKERISPHMTANVVERLQDLSALLVKQTQELQETLSAKTRQICQLRWELLHRDLSTVKLETELHSRNAHRKRSKYAHFRSHSSEEATAANPLPEELSCGKSAIITEAYYNPAPETEFKATELSNTVQELSRELLKLTSAADHSQDEETSSNVYQDTANTQDYWMKSGLQSKSPSQQRRITVRRNSADNISANVEEDELWRKNISSDSDDSSDDGYTKISWKTGTRINYPVNLKAERLLMPCDKSSVRTYQHRRKKLQNVSSPNRRRSNTFHNKRDFEKPVICSVAPQKCHSFRVARERSVEDCHSFQNIQPYTILSIRHLLSDAKYQELLSKRANMVLNANIQRNRSAEASELSNLQNLKDCLWLREVASDSKIPFLVEDDEKERGSLKYPTRSQSDKHKNERAAERRENFQRKRIRKRITSPDLISDAVESLRIARAQSCRKVQKTVLSKEQLHNINLALQKSMGKFQSSAELGAPEKSPSIPSSHPEPCTVTIQLPKRKSKKSQPKALDENNENTITIVIPKKRSLSSEKESETPKVGEHPIRSVNSNLQTNTEFDENGVSESSTDSKLHIQNTYIRKLRSGVNKTNFNNYLDSNQDTSLEGARDDQISRKRKAEDTEISMKYTQISDVRCNEETGKSSLPDKYSQTVEGSDQIGENNNPSSYVKSPSAPQLEWMKYCAKKISREGAPNVRSLIERYNRVAENPSLRSTTSSSASTPLSARKISSPIFNSVRDHLSNSCSLSTPTSPNIVSASAFYNPLVFRPVNLDFSSKSPPQSPASIARNEALRKAKESFISSNHVSDYSGNIRATNRSFSSPSNTEDKQLMLSRNDSISKSQEHRLSISSKSENILTRKQNNPEDDRVSNSSMDSMSLVVFRTGESCQESRLSKRSADCSRTESDAANRNNLKTSKSLSNSSLFKHVLNTDFKMPSSLLRLKKSKRKKDMSTVGQLCRQSLMLTADEVPSIPQASHKSCPASPELKSKSETKPSWFHRNILRHK